jgi:hypothetical protein
MRKVIRYRELPRDIRKVERRADRLDRSARVESDSELRQLYQADARRLRAIARNLKVGKHRRAGRLFWGSDTAIQEEIPARLYRALEDERHSVMFA